MTSPNGEEGGHCPTCGDEPTWWGAYQKTVAYAITLLEVHGDGATCLKYLRAVEEKFK